MNRHFARWEISQEAKAVIQARDNSGPDEDEGAGGAEGKELGLSAARKTEGLGNWMVTWEAGGVMDSGNHWMVSFPELMETGLEKTTSRCASGRASCR